MTRNETMILFLSLLGCFLLGSQRVDAACANECCTSLDEIFNNEIFNLSPQLTAVHREYILCPDTTYTTKTVVDVPGFDFEAAPGDYAIFLRSNATIKCGDDGNPANNCIVGNDGSYGLAIQYVTEDEQEGYPRVLENVLIEGITFTRVTTSMLEISGYSTGHVTFKDCVFQDGRLEFLFNFFGFGIPSETSVLCPDDEFTPDDFTYTFDGSIFENIDQPLLDSITDPSLFMMFMVCNGQTMVLKDNVFQNIDYARVGADEVESTALIGTYVHGGGNFVLERNCFLNVSVLGHGPVEAFCAPDDANCIVSVDNYVDESSFAIGAEANGCKGFRTWQRSVQDSETGLFVPLDCVAPGSDSCMARAFVAATESPTAPPSMAETEDASPSRSPGTLDAFISTPNPTTAPSTAGGITFLSWISQMVVGFVLVLLLLEQRFVCY